QIVFGNAEQHRNRLKLRDHDHAARVRRPDDVSFIDQSQSDLAADRRDDSRVRDLKIGVINLSLVRLNRTIVLPDRCDLEVELLLWNEPLIEQQLVPLLLDLRRLKQRLVASQLSPGLRKLHLK